MAEVLEPESEDVDVAGRLYQDPTPRRRSHRAPREWLRREPGPCELREETNFPSTSTASGPSSPSSESEGGGKSTEKYRAVVEGALRSWRERKGVGFPARRGQLLILSDEWISSSESFSPADWQSAVARFGF